MHNNEREGAWPNSTGGLSAYLMIPEVTDHPRDLAGVASLGSYAQADLCYGLVPHFPDLRPCSYQANEAHLQWLQTIGTVS